jgi:hypothetical protein
MTVDLCPIDVLPLHPLSIMGLFATFSIRALKKEWRYAEWRYAEWRYAEWRYAECRDYLNVLQSVNMLSVVMLSVVMLSVFMLSVVILSVIC